MIKVQLFIFTAKFSFSQIHRNTEKLPQNLKNGRSLFSSNALEEMGMENAPSFPFMERMGNMTFSNQITLTQITNRP